MRFQQLATEFREELSKLSVEVQSSAAMGHFDLNKICEDVFCGIFKELFELPNLRNLNEEEKANYPGIDLASDEERVAVQVTSEKTLEKVKDTLRKVIDHSLHKKYDRVIIYTLTQKQSSYAQGSIDKVTDGKIRFSVKDDILDFRDISTNAANAQPKVLKRCVDILRSYNRGCDVGLADEDFDPPDEPEEQLSANFLELYIPSKLYIAEIVPEVFKSKGKPARNQRRKFKNYTIDNEVFLPGDFEVHSKKLVTFHNLEEPGNVFAPFIDEGTIEAFSPDDFYSIDADYERVFKSLLRFCLQKKLGKHRVRWMHKDNLFVFLPYQDSDNTRVETWIGKKKAEREVFARRYQSKDPTKIWFTRHFAFAVDFINLDDGWYVAITPDWYFSYGEYYYRTKFGDKLLTGLKKRENNRAIFNQFRFLSSWLSELDEDDLFSEEESGAQFLTFGSILSVPGGCSLDESIWETLEEKPEDDPLQRSFL